MTIMDKNNIKEALNKLKESSKKRNFKQTYELILNLKGLDMKKSDNHIELFVPMHYSKGKPIKLCAFVAIELKETAEKIFDTTIFVNDFPKYQKDKKLIKQLANDHGFFVAQATIMPKVAQVFGKVLGTRGKMPNPKAGCIVPPKVALQPLYDRLQKTAKLKAKQQQVIKVAVGVEDQKEEEVIDNVMTLYNTLIHTLPKEENNIKSIMLKLTMSKPINIK